MPNGPLQNVRIIELGHVIAGPLAATLLADFGADVIKVERPDGGDMMRDLGPKADDGVGVWWKTLARNKRLIALDWKTGEGRKILRTLVESAQVLIENFRPGVLERAGVGPEILHQWNPDLVILRVSGYGQSGPFVKLPAFGRAAEAMSGLPHLTGPADGAPVHPGFPAADSTTGLMGALGIMMALFANKDTGAGGQVIDLAVFETIFRLIDYHVPALTGAGLSAKRNGSRQPLDFAPGGMFQTQDSVWITISAGSAETAQRLLRAAGGDEWANQSRFSSMVGITGNMEEISQKLDSYISKRNFEQVQEEFRKHDAVAARVLNMEEILAHPQINHRGDIVEVENEKTQVVGPIPHMDKTPGSIKWLGKGLIGADTQSVLQQAGLSDSEINQLADNNIIAISQNSKGQEK